MVPAGYYARVRRRVRLWFQGFGALLARRQVEREVFSPRVRYLERSYLGRLSASSAPDFRSRERAAVLLADHLSTSQRRWLRRRDFFIVTAKSGRRFRVWARRQRPVELIDSTNARWRHQPWLYCVNSELTEDGAVLPLADQLLGLKLCLEGAEEYFLVTANPNFEQGQIEKTELLRKAGSPDSLTPRRLTVGAALIAGAEGLSSDLEGRAFPLN
jgi:hypothetical protein